MQESQQRIQTKKTRRLTLTGIRFPPPPPYTSSISSIAQKIKEQEISNTSSSSQQQMYYENYFMIQLQTLIHDLIGQNIHYQIQQLKEHNGDEDQQVVDVVVKVEFGVGDQQAVMDRIKVLKEINQKEKKQEKIFRQKLKKQSNNKNQASKNNKERGKQKISLQQQQTQSTSTRNLRPQKLFGSAEWKQEQNSVHQINQSSIDISSQFKKSRKSKTIDNEASQQQVKQQYGILKSKEDKGSEDGDDEGHHSIQAIEIQQKKLRKTQNKMKPNKIACFCVTIVFLIIALFVASILLKNNAASKQYPNAQSNNNYAYPGAKFPYQGDIGYNIKKKTYIIPTKYQDETNKLQVFIQILGAVKNPQQSLHPMNLTYYRPSMAKLFTFPSIDKHDNQKIYVLNYTHREEQLEKYLGGFGENENQRMIGLYRELHKQGSNLPTILAQAQYYYLSKKYGIDQAESKPLCLISYTRNSYSTNRFLPFFTTLFSQNYTNYRLVYIEDSPAQQYESVRVMNHIWTHFYNQLANIGSGQFYFLQLDQYIGSVLAKTAAARELCGVGDIVVEIDGLGELIGRQSLGVLSLGYDGGSQRMSLMPKAAVTNYPYFEVKSRKQSNLKSQQLGRTNNQRSKPPEMLIPYKKGNGENSIQMTNQVNKQQTKEIKQDQIFIARAIGDVWTAYSNYMYSQKLQDSDEIKYNFINSTYEQERYHNFSLQLKMSANPQQIIPKLPKQHLSSPCLKSYILPLQTKLEISKSKHTSNFGYDLEIYHKMLQLSGRFNPNMKIRHYRQMNEPLCYRSDVMVVSECEQKIKVYEQVLGMRTNELISLTRILGEQGIEKQSRQESPEQLNKLIQKLAIEMKEQCKSQKSE